MLDIRVPMGVMFVLLGGVLAGYGALTIHDSYAKSLNINVNLWWGLVILFFGVILLLLAWWRRNAVVKEEVTAEPPSLRETGVPH